MQPNYSNMYQKPTAKLNKLVKYKHNGVVNDLAKRCRFLEKKGC